MNKFLAQAEHTIGNEISPDGVVSNTFSQTDQAPLTLQKIISSIIGVLTIVAILYFLFVLITGALSYISSGSDKNKVEEARNKISTGIVGLIIVISAIFLADLLGYLLGVNILEFYGLFINSLP